ncbi:MAG: hypothetical protein IK149_05830 [Oscillospiraceae bacterium]|nr:hypothetical protein [Oscillospiraceae bacterium]
MKITKKNGNVSLYDDEKVARSILKANADTRSESITPAVAAALADTVFLRLTQQHEIISTADVRSCVVALLRERGLYQTAESYAEYTK